MKFHELSGMYFKCMVFMLSTCEIQRGHTPKRFNLPDKNLNDLFLPFPGFMIILLIFFSFSQWAQAGVSFLRNKQTQHIGKLFHLAADFKEESLISLMDLDFSCLQVLLDLVQQSLAYIKNRL